MRSLEAKITLSYTDAKTAEAIAKAISPDNRVTPAGLKIETIQKGNRVVTDIICKDKLATFTATIDDLLFCASTAEKTIKTIKQ